jgi:hypothetical protein
VKIWGWCVGQNRAFLGLLRSLLFLKAICLRSLLGSLISSFLGGFLAFTSGSREKGHISLCLLCHLALLYISLVGFLVGLEGALFLDCIEGWTHMHEKCLARSAVPDGEAEFRIYPNGSLEALVNHKSHGAPHKPTGQENCELREQDYLYSKQT